MKDIIKSNFRRVLSGLMLAILMIGMGQAEAVADTTPSAPIGRFDRGMEKIKPVKKGVVGKGATQSEQGIAGTYWCNHFSAEVYTEYSGAYLNEDYGWSWYVPDNVACENNKTVVTYSSPNNYFSFESYNNAPVLEAIKIHLDPERINNAYVRAGYADFSTGTLYYSNTEIVADYANNILYWKPETKYDKDNIFFYVEAGELNIIGFEVYSESKTPDDFLAGSSAKAVNPPVFRPESCTFTDSISVEILAEDGCRIYYRTDGVSPTVDEQYRYRNPIAISETTTFGAISVDANGNTSRIASSVYTCTRHGIGEDYDPDSPANPGANYYDPVSGKAIIDDFSPGYLSSTLSKVVGSNNYANVNELIVKGRLSSSDLSVLKNFTKAETIDISRTGGISSLPGQTFIYLNASSILLPSTVTSLGNYEFAYCENLASLTIYAQNPPTCSSYTFEYFNKGNCALYVPASSVALYKASSYWKDFKNILPIADDAHVLQVNLPAEASDGRYKNNSLEIVNVNTGVRQKYVISDRLLYTFNGLQEDERYDIFMFSQSGLELGRIENVVIPDKDIEVTFDNLKSLHTVYAKVLDSEGSDVTSEVSVEWLKPLADGTSTYLRKSASLGEIPEGQELICRVTLDSKLGTLYANPKDVRFAIDANRNTCMVNLVPFRSIELSGSVVDADGGAINGASVSATQTLNGKYAKTYTTKTDRKGLWSLSVLDSPETSVTFAASDCVNVHRTIEAFDSGVSSYDLGKTVMNPINGARITYGFTYKTAGGEETQTYYPDYRNVAIDVFNLTQNREQKELSLQYPILAVLDANVNAGDELRLTATSKTGAFNPVVETVTIGESMGGEVTFDIVDKGGIEATFEMTDNVAVIAMLYSEKGEFLKKATYSNAKATFTGLEDGEYTLVSMGQSDLMNSILRLPGFAEVGLTEGKDYVKNAVKVESGKLVEVKNPVIPAFDDTPLYYTNSSTNFSVNKSSVTTGNYLTLRASIDFKNQYKDAVSNVALVVDLPEACDFVEQSVIQGPTLMPYTLDNNRLTIQLGNNYQSQTRFCVIPTKGGSFNAAGSIVFDYNGKTVTQPIGSAVSEVKDLEINVPNVIGRPEFKVSGTALSYSTVSVYDAGSLIGNGKANAAGRWSVECELSNPYNLSTHSIYAEITTTDGNILTTESKPLTYDQTAPRVSKVTMYHWNPEINNWEGRMEISEFDFLNPKTSTNRWVVYYPKKKFTYTIEFTDNDPERISNVVLYVHTADYKRVPVKASYDENRGFWYAEIDMGSSPDNYYPVNCSVEFDVSTDFRADYRRVEDSIEDYNQLKDTYQLINNELKDCDELSEVLLIYQTHDIPFNVADCDSQEYENFLGTLSDEELLALVEDESDLDIEGELVSNVEDVLKGVEAFFTPSTEFSAEPEDDIEFISKSCDGLSKEELIAQGFASMLTTDNEELLYLNTDTKSIYVDFRLNQYIEMSTKEQSRYKAPWERVQEFVEWHNRIQGALNTVRSAYMDLQNQIGNLYEALDGEAERFNGKLSRSSKRWQEYHELQKRTEIAIKSGKLSGKELADAQSTVARCSRMKDHYNTEIKGFVRQLKLIPVARKCVKLLVPTLENIIPIARYVDIAAEGFNIIQTVADAFSQIPEECECDVNAPVEARAYVLMSGGVMVNTLAVKLATESVLDLATAGQVISSPLSGGATLASAFATVLTKMALSLALDCAYDKMKSDRMKEISSMIAKCKEKCNSCKDPDDDDDDHDGGGDGSGSPDDDVQIDPSGFVYEAVPENRVEGVQATIYYKETKEDMYGDPYEEVVLWDAEAYAQENPLFTDENGMYRWDVPQGLWQVKFEKDGYVTAYSEWLPVPPPQLEVNIGIVQNKQPEVIEARAYEEGVEVQFDKYMDPATLTEANIFVTANNEKLNGEIRLIDSALADEYASEEDSDATRYVSRVRFVPEERLSANTGEIRLTVSRNVLSYAGIPMTETFSQVLDVEKEVQVVYADDVKVLYGGEKEVTVYALPFDAAVGRKLHIENSSELILTVDTTEATIDEEGKAVVKVKGGLPGRARLKFTIDDVTAEGECIVDVMTEIVTAEAPKASRASGTAVYRGTQIVLTTESKNGTIYYTTDGSCPCDENGTRRKYTSPIVINDDTQILAITSIGEGENEVSEIVRFNYTLKRSDMDFQMEEGWTWLSHSFESGVDASRLAEDENVVRIQSQTREIIRDPQMGMVGTLTELNASESYKVETKAPTTRMRLSDIAWNPATPIALNAGWNWLGYPVTQTMSVDEAFATTDAETLDVIVGQNGFAQYDGEKWVGTLETMSPGMGYMYQSRTAKEVVYNTSIVSSAYAKSASGISANSPLALDVHKYGSIMPVVATLGDIDGTPLDNEDYEVAAFSGSECRGIGRVVNGLVMMNVYGNANDPITFLVTDAEGENSYANDASLDFTETVIGDIYSPYPIIVNKQSGVGEVNYDGNVKVTVEGDMLRISGIPSENIRFVEVYDIEGRKLIHETNVTESGIRIDSLITGIYVVIVNGEGEYTYHKISVR